MRIDGKAQLEHELALKRKLIPLALHAAPAHRPAMLFVDTRFPGVDVPPEHMGAEDKCFGLTHRLAQFIDTNEHGVRASLDFGARTYRCFFPWDAIHGLVVNDSAWGFVRVKPPRVN